jgi:hypothetical protein
MHPLFRMSQNKAKKETLFIADQLPDMAIRTVLRFKHTKIHRITSADCLTAAAELFVNVRRLVTHRALAEAIEFFESGMAGCCRPFKEVIP